MITKIFMHPHGVFVFSVVMMLSLQTTSTTNQSVTVGGIKCIKNERRALLDVQSCQQGALVSRFDEQEEDCCKWYGVTCDNTTGHVTKLRMDDLLGEIRPSLLNLTYLTYLDLSFNSFNGPIPKFIGYMSRLRYLDLGYSNFTGTIPSSIGFLTQLRYLDLRRNNFSGTIPSSIGSLTQLRYLDLKDNSFGGTVPPEIGNLTKLETFSLGCSGICVIENADWLSGLSSLQKLSMTRVFLAKANNWKNVIRSLQKLSVLYLSECDLSQVKYPSSSFINSSSSSISFLFLTNNNLNSSMYRWLFPLTSNRLESLDLSENMLDGIPKYLGNLCGLTTLSVRDNSAVIDFSDFLNNLSGCTSAKLETLDVSSSHFIGSVSDEIQNFSSMHILDLSRNHLNGTISERLWELPRLRRLDGYSNYLRGAISESIGKSKICYIDFSNTFLEGVPVSSEDHMSNNSYVEHIYLRSCNLGPRFPKWIQKLKNLAHLDISNNKISDTIHLEFWDTWPSQLVNLNLSSNNITGEVPDLSSSFDDLAVIDLSSNRLYGLIPNVPSTLSILNLSGNKFYGRIDFLCQIVDGYLQFLDLSNNFLIGQIPDCLWHFKNLKVLNLGYNNLFGRLPDSLKYLITLEVLYLYKNNFAGELPLSLKNCTNLNYLNLGANKFSGNVPVWIGENLSELYVLSLGSNNLFGTIPVQLCQLVSLQLLDLSMNNLYGTIPSCLNNLTTMVGEGFIPERVVHVISIRSHGSKAILYIGGDVYIDHVTIGWQGNIREFSKINLGLLRSIDLSSNNLTGQLPYELTLLHGMLALNLSRNALHGEIPRDVGEMKKLLTLDLSRNNFSGGIPSSMSRLTSLNYLDVSYNNLSGRIPSSTQLQSFPPSRYIENTGICGPPVTKSCPGDEEVPPVVVESEGGEEDKNELQRWFNMGGGIGFVVGFWIACGTLVLNHKWGHALFHFVNRLKDWIYVKLVVFISKLPRGFRDI